MATPNVLGAYELLRRLLQQQSLQQQGTDFGSTPNAAPEQYSDSYGSPQGGLLGRMPASQAEQSPYQPLAGNSGQAPIAPPDPNFRQLSRAAITIRPLGAIAPLNRPDDPSSRSYSPVEDSSSVELPRESQQGDHAAQPNRSLSDRIQAVWDHPHPYGPVSMLKETLNGIEQAVQGAIDATSVPSTEEEAFRQNLGRERGPIGAWQAVSRLAPMAPRGTGGIFAVPLVGTSRNGLPSLPAGVRIMRQGIDGPAANTNVPAARLVSRGRNLSPEHQNPPGPANGTATAVGVATQNPTQAAPQASGELRGADEDKPTLPRIAATPTMKTNAEGLNGEGTKVPPTLSLNGGGAEDKNDCKEERRRALEICSDAIGNGWRGDGRRWKSDYAVGPYSKPSGEPWNMWDCMRGFVSEPCGGNSKIDQRKTKPKVKRYSLRSRKKR